MGWWVGLAVGCVWSERGRRAEMRRGASVAQLRGARTEFAAAVFDRGGDIETLKARCLAETGLPPPTTPVPGRGAGGRRVPVPGPR